MLVEAGANVNAADVQGRTPLCRAAFRNHFEVSQMLVEARADVNSVDTHGWTPLHAAARIRHGLAVSEMLVRAGADVHSTTDDVGRRHSPLSRSVGQNGDTSPSTPLEKGRAR
mmetsp:Transcript_39622/g.93084  ORF Transcript_39622/g.93084 Transcript_39622/m.93084 type:complete len:113 (+) Transcript_39622:3-341(+)